MNKSDFFNISPIDLNFEETAPDYSKVVPETSDAIESNITNDTIKNTIIRDANIGEVSDKAYLVDLSNVENITEQSLQSINDLLLGGDVAVNIRYGESIQNVGHSEEHMLFRLLPPLVNQLYGEDAKLYVKKKNKYVPFDKYDVNIITFNLR